MNFKQLEIFKTIMDTGSTMAAAAQLGLSQSAISRQLASLEEEIGRELFLRDKGRLIPRPEAHLLVDEVDDVAQSVARLRVKVGDVRSGAFGEALIRVAFPHSLATTMLPPILARFKADHPRVTVEILSGPYDAIERMVRGRVADLGFVRLPPEEHSFDTRPLFTSGTTCVMPVGHPLAAKQAIDVNDLARNDLILLGRQRINRNELEHELRRMVPSYRCSLEVHSVETACACAAQGLGIAIVPSLIAEFFRSDAVAMRPFLPDKVADYGIITMSGAPLSWTAEAFINIIKADSGESAL
ncbi:LysR family transcriptional regulator [Neorhizobium galegae]|uniref:LysR family transcriptional regulator n=1 Tax=Neorhizobium galegae TaxID=399 RepID=UPI0006229EF9|nr:LysR family transcriptional regulator [Neorhizobium galegae]CDZ30910.1 Transcriptional activator protein LysR [Neorhizobium galegae bv. officinalis]KAA9385384.1 LysR family transcriptional regulator [Neorhizobium galegae]KAB1113147.1 LysR family transcriptional regulator [Neorhizobium galegae]MCM2499402.1 LysR family transcriptional regulator [Neorhizobium galegae]MCQ1767065.1 LysR family transcriptional regulator [Neorhizobium galegae]